MDKNLDMRGNPTLDCARYAHLKSYIVWLCVRARQCDERGEHLLAQAARDDIVATATKMDRMVEAADQDIR